MTTNFARVCVAAVMLAAGASGAAAGEVVLLSKPSGLPVKLSSGGECVTPCRLSAPEGTALTATFRYRSDRLSVPVDPLAAGVRANPVFADFKAAIARAAMLPGMGLGAAPSSPVPASPPPTAETAFDAFTMDQLSAYCAQGWDRRQRADGRFEINPCRRAADFR